LILLRSGGADRKIEEENDEDPKSHTLEKYYKDGSPDHEVYRDP
jgi:hypothetical protein